MGATGVDAVGSASGDALAGGPANLYAWAHALTPAEAEAYAARFPGLGLVLNGGNYAAAARLPVPPIASVNNVPQAEQVAAAAGTGVAWRCAVVMDERNAAGPSGGYLAPEAYARRFEAMAAPLRAAQVRVVTMGLQPVGGAVRSLVGALRFDDAYHWQLPPADGRAFNPNGVPLREVERVLRAYPGPWLLSPAPFRPWWGHLLQPVGVRRWAALSTRPDVIAVALWCLREVPGGPWFGGRWQWEHGLLDREGRVTVVGREVIRVMG